MFEVSMIVESSLIVARLTLSLLFEDEESSSMIVERIQSILAFLLTEEPWSLMKQSLPTKASIWTDSLINGIHKYLHHHPNAKIFQITHRIQAKIKSSPPLRWNLFIEYLSSPLENCSFLKQLLSSISSFSFYNTTQYKMRKRTKDSSFCLDQQGLLKLLTLYKMDPINDILLLSFKAEMSDEIKSILSNIGIICPSETNTATFPPGTIGHLLTIGPDQNLNVIDQSAKQLSMMEIDESPATETATTTMPSKELLMHYSKLPTLIRCSLCLPSKERGGLPKQLRLKEKPSILKIEKLTKSLTHSLLVEGDFKTFTLLLQVLRLWMKGWTRMDQRSIPPSILFPLLMVMDLSLLSGSTAPFYSKCYEIISAQQKAPDYNPFLLVIPLLILSNLQRQQGKEGNAMKLRNTIFRTIIPTYPSSTILRMLCGKAILLTVPCIDLQQLEAVLVDSSKRLEPLHSVELLQKTCTLRGAKKLFTFSNTSDSPIASILCKAATAASTAEENDCQTVLCLKHIELFLQSTPDLGPFDVSSFDSTTTTTKTTTIPPSFIERVASFVERRNFSHTTTIASLIDKYLVKDPLNDDVLRVVSEIKRKIKQQQPLSAIKILDIKTKLQMILDDM